LVAPATGPRNTVFTITWASAPPPVGYVYDVQIKVPSGVWTDWMTNQVVGSATLTGDVKGTYSFQARLRNVSNGKFSKWSPVATAKVTT
jgi:hypothetical protein